MFTRVVFALAGILGLGSLVPLYQLQGPYQYHALLGGIAAWQILFLMIAWRPTDLRLAMIPAVLEKALWVVALVVFHSRGTLNDVELAGGAIPHGLLGVLFAVAYFRTTTRVTHAPPPPPPA
jgi:hypothetical protein